MSSKQKRHFETTNVWILDIFKIRDINHRILGRGGSLRPYSRSYHMRSTPEPQDIRGNPMLSAVNQIKVKQNSTVLKALPVQWLPCPVVSLVLNR